ncbi:MAG TPA: hypothetical protein VM243_04350 [Phycisphaerae bacterium]|nr:hypothetical protein [Phycisphaerae bacterium]
MLSRLLIVRLKAAENALKDGRYDDAFRMATEPDIREHRRGASVLQKLTDRYLDRARAHFKADRYAEALLDLTKAQAGGVKTNEIAELREQIRTVAEEELRKDNSKRLRLQAARRRIERGSLRAGQRLLDEVGDDDPDAMALKRRVEDHQDDAAQWLSEAQRFFANGQVTEAIERLNKAKSAEPNAADAAELEAKISKQVIEQARAALQAGRVNRAIDELARLGSIGQSRSDRRELADCIDKVRQAAACLGDSRFEEVRQEVLRLEHLMPGVKWVGRTSAQLKQLDDLLLALRAGPLGQCADSGAVRVAVGSGPAVGGKADPLAETIRLATPPLGGGTLPQRLLLLIDGGGSFLVLRGDRVSLGRAAAKLPADVPIFSDLSEHHAEIARVDDDYFLFATRDIEVGGRKTRHQLLRDGDRVGLGRRARFTFRLPNRKSPSAILQMSDSTRLPNDVRQVVLLRQTAMLGVGPSVHIACRSAQRGLLLFERAGGLWVQLQGRDGAAEGARPIEIGRTIEMAGVSFTVEPWQVRSAGQSFA